MLPHLKQSYNTCDHFPAWFGHLQHIRRSAAVRDPCRRSAAVRDPCRRNAAAPTDAAAVDPRYPAVIASRWEQNIFRFLKLILHLFVLV